MASIEKIRLKEDKLRAKNWKRWGPYLSERQWGTVREDYSADGNCWDHLSHDQSRSRAYRWGEDGLLGITDRQCRLCLCLALWNTKDPILKERLFGLTGHQGNHGEDVKELYYYLDSTPTYSYMKSLYKYPQKEYPYSKLVEENRRRTNMDPEYELLDTGIFKENRYFDVQAEYCKASPNDILGRYTVSNRGPERAVIHVMPTLWFRNVWSWGDDCDAYVFPKPFMSQMSPGKVICEHSVLGIPQVRVRTGSAGSRPNLEVSDDGFRARSGSLGSPPRVRRYRSISGTLGTSPRSQKLGRSVSEEVENSDSGLAIPNSGNSARRIRPRTYSDSMHNDSVFSTSLGASPLSEDPPPEPKKIVQNDIPESGCFVFEVDKGPDGVVPEILFTENDTNYRKLYNCDNEARFVKDAFHAYVIKGDTKVVNPKRYGTKCAAHYVLSVEPGEEVELRVRLYFSLEAPIKPFSKLEFDEVFVQRKVEAELFYDEVIVNRSKVEKNIIRQAYAGLLMSKQFYYYILKEWLEGDPKKPQPPHCRKWGRNHQWQHLFNRDVISMPDKWEYPWYASWDLAFHMIPMADVDLTFAKDQLILFMREWYMHPSGQIPAYEFSFDDVNPPVHAYAVLKVYKASGVKGKRDIIFLAKCFHKLVINFTWWVNRKDVEGKNIFSGGFLGLDNIGVFDRSKPLLDGGYLAQADASAWMGFFCSIMLEISLILARRDKVYEDMASKFFEHYVALIDAMNSVDGVGLWDEEDAFYYDHVRNNHRSQPLKIKSMVGLVPMFCTLVVKESDMRHHHEFGKRTKWFIEHRKDKEKLCFMEKEDKFMMSFLNREKLLKVLHVLLDEEEFLSPYGIRSLSKKHREHPFVLNMGGNSYSVKYEPGESESNMFGGNSNWRGPIWLPMNYLLIENLQRFDYYYEDSLMVECPTRSGNSMRLREVAAELSRRLANLFVPDMHDRRPCHGNEEKYATDPHFKNLCLFYEYFHGDTGRGCGASHQTGWTALIINILQKCHYLDENLSDYISEGSVAGIY